MTEEQATEIISLLRRIAGALDLRTNAARASKSAEMNKLVEAIGIPADLLCSRSKEAWLVDARSVVALRLRQRGFTCSEINRQLKRANGAAHHMIRRTTMPNPSKNMQAMMEATE
jgi:cytochrome c